MSIYWISWFLLMLTIFVLNYDITIAVREPSYTGKRMKTRKGRDIMAYRGILYGIPPVDEQRFLEPLPILKGTNWSYPAEYDKARCIQRTVDPHVDEILGIEECLHLNVYTPVLPSTKSLPRYPVIVWFHGGGFQTGSGHGTSYSPTYLLDHDLVLVVANYRVGPFGFLSTGDHVLHGNYGLKDQVAVLKWVQAQIAIFGGDVDTVTIAGHGAGAASVIHHLRNPKLKGLFHRAIAQSGSALNPWAYQHPDHARNLTETIALRLGCPTKDSMALLVCMQGKRAENILATLSSNPGFGLYTRELFRPTLERHAVTYASITSEPSKLSYISNVPLMTGWTTHEGALLAASLFGRNDDTLLIELRARLPNLIPEMLRFDEDCSPRNRIMTTHKIYRHYLGQEEISLKNRMAIVEMLSDGLYKMGILETVLQWARRFIPVYAYQFGYQGSASHTSHYGDTVRKYGVAHRDDLLYLFPIVDQSFSGVTMSKKDYEMVDIMTGLWYNFAKYGNPAQDPVAGKSVDWPLAGHAERQYFSITDPRNLTLGEIHDFEALNLWNKFPCNAGRIAPAVGNHDEL